MNVTDKKYLIGFLIFVISFISLEFIAYSFAEDQYISSISYDERQIDVELEFSSKNSINDNKLMSITFFDKTKQENVKNLTFFMTITNGNSQILKEYFYVNDEKLEIYVLPDIENKLLIKGNQQYNFDAYIMTPSAPIQIEGPFLIQDEKYTIILKFKTIDNLENIVSHLEPIEFEIDVNKMKFKNNENFKNNLSNERSSINFLEVEANQKATLNNFGFRGQDIEPENLEQKLRIFLLGGSTMYGTGATSDDTTISGHLNQIIIDSFSSKQFEIINAGIQGINSDVEKQVLEKDIIPLNPDYVIVFDGWNDLQKDHSPTVIYKNWKFMCELGNKHGFETSIILQPIAGFGEKSLSERERYFAEKAVDEFGTKLISKISIYQEYKSKLKSLPEYCTTHNFVGIFDSNDKEVYYDEGHLNDYGNELIAKEFFQLYHDDFISLSKQISFKQNIPKSDIFLQITFQELISNYKTPDFILKIFQIN